MVPGRIELVQKIKKTDLKVKTAFENARSNKTNDDVVRCDSSK